MLRCTSVGREKTKFRLIQNLATSVALVSIISHLYCSRLSTEHLTLSSPRAKMYLYLLAVYHPSIQTAIKWVWPLCFYSCQWRVQPGWGEMSSLMLSFQLVWHELEVCIWSRVNRLPSIHKFYLLAYVRNNCAYHVFSLDLFFSNLH